MKKLEKKIEAFIELSSIFGVSKADIITAKDFLDHDEFGLAFETIVDQMGEYDIEINDEFYLMIEEIGLELKLEERTYSFMKDLVRRNNEIPNFAKEQIARIIKSLKSTK